MLSTTDAIVLSIQPLSDKAHVLHAYTRESGRVNYRVYGLGRRHAIGLYTPFSLLRITSDNHSGKPPTLKEATPYGDGRTGEVDIYKSTVALFISEVLYHVLRHPMPDEPMFDFLTEEIQVLATTSAPQNFHLRFLVGFAAKLGFAIPEGMQVSTDAMSSLTRKERQHQLRALCEYFAEHVETWQPPRSMDVLTEVFD